MRLATAAIALCLLAVPALTNRLEADGFDDACTEARGKTLPALEGLAAWCDENKLPATRNAVAGEILEFDTDNKQARKWLKYRKSGSEWKSPSAPPRVKDKNDEALALYAQTRAEHLEPVASGLHAALTEYANLIKPVQREHLLAEIIEIAPANTDYRREHGEVEGPDGWELRETANARKQREVHARVLSDARKAVAEIQERAPLVEELEEAAGWRSALTTGRVTVATTGPQAEAEQIARDVHIIPEVFDGALGALVELPAGLSIYLLANQSEAAKLVEAMPPADPVTLEHWKSHGSCWLGEGTHRAVYQSSPAWRRESVTRTFVSRGLALGMHLSASDSAAVFEAFVALLTHKLVGTRHLIAKRPSRYKGSPAPWGDTSRLRRDGWFRGARKILAHDGPEELAAMMNRPLRELTIEDYIVINAVAAYFFEGRPAACVGMIRSIGRKATFKDALDTEAKLDIGTLHARLIRWLDERGSAD